MLCLPPILYKRFSLSVFQARSSGTVVHSGTARKMPRRPRFEPPYANHFVAHIVELQKLFTEIVIFKYSYFLFSLIEYYCDIVYTIFYL